MNPAKATLIGFSAIAFILTVSTAISANATSLVQVNGESMLPTYKPGQLLFTDSTPFGQLKVGDVITFQSERQPGTEIVHRIVDSTEYEDGSVTFETVGDNPQGRWFEDVSESMYLGKVFGNAGSVGL